MRLGESFARPWARAIRRKAARCFARNMVLHHARDQQLRVFCDDDRGGAAELTLLSRPAFTHESRGQPSGGQPRTLERGGGKPSRPTASIRTDVLRSSGRSYGRSPAMDDNSFGVPSEFQRQNGHPRHRRPRSADGGSSVAERRDSGRRGHFHVLQITTHRTEAPAQFLMGSVTPLCDDPPSVLITIGPLYFFASRSRISPSSFSVAGGSGGAAGAASAFLCRRLTCLIIRKTAKATIRKSSTVLQNTP
jgi:hypothetical protein